MADLPESVAQDVRYQRLVEERERSAKRARGAKKTYVTLTRLTVASTALAAIAGGLVLYGLEAQPDANRWLVTQLSDSTIRTILVVFQAICLAIAVGCGFFLGQQNPKKIWIGARLAAEDGRLRLAERALQISGEQETPVLVQTGEWFVGFIDKQLAHLDGSAREHSASNLWIIILGALLAGVMALASSLASVQNSTLIVAIAIFGVCAPALVTAVSSWGEAAASSKRAQLHEETWTELNALRDGISEFRRALTAHNLKEALDFAQTVFAVLRKDHQGFAGIHTSEQEAIE